MNPDFWHDRWANRQIGFHQPDSNPFLVKYFPILELSADDVIFIPLCGKTLDIHWLLKQGLHVTGAELSEIAVQELFEELGVEPVVNELGKLKHYGAFHLDIFVGDMFDVSDELLGKVDAVYDRAALVALPEDMRADYARHLARITDKAPQLLLSFEYEQSRMEPPPFSVDEAEIRRCYGASAQIKLLERTAMESGFRGITACDDVVWRIDPVYFKTP